MAATGTSQYRYSSPAADYRISGATAAALSAALLVAQPANDFALPSDGTVTVAPATSGWIASAMDHIRSLQADWDGYGADPISAMVISQMQGLLADYLPKDSAVGSIVPGADGSLQAEWHFEAVAIGFLVEANSRISCWIRHHGHEEVERFGLDAGELLRGAALTYLK